MKMWKLLMLAVYTQFVSCNICRDTTVVSQLNANATENIFSYFKNGGAQYQPVFGYTQIVLGQTSGTVYRIRRCLVLPKRPKLSQISEETRQRCFFTFYQNFTIFLPKEQLEGCFINTVSYLN